MTSSVLEEEAEKDLLRLLNELAQSKLAVAQANQQQTQTMMALGRIIMENPAAGVKKEEDGTDPTAFLWSSPNAAVLMEAIEGCRESSATLTAAFELFGTKVQEMDTFVTKYSGGSDGQEDQRGGVQRSAETAPGVSDGGLSDQDQE